MRRRLLVLTLCVLALGCSQRERTNPLDAGNPNTGGRPQGFIALAGYASVTLNWTPQPALGIDGFMLTRMGPTDPSYRVLGGLLTASDGHYLDTSVSNGATYRYRLYYVIRGGAAQQPAEDEATPGPLRVLVADAGAGLVLLTPDGRHVSDVITDAGQPQSVEIDPTDGHVWTADAYNAVVTSRDLGGFGGVSISGMHSPYAIAIDRADHSAWVSDLDGSVAHWQPNGEPAVPASIGGGNNPLANPDGIAIDLRDRSLWVCERDANRIRRYDVAAHQQASAPLALPSRVAADSATGLAWVASPDRGVLWRLRSDGSVVDSTRAASAPNAIAFDHARGRAWVADPGANRLLELDLATLALVRSVGGLVGPRDVAVDPLTGDVWCVEPDRHAVSRFDSTGTLRERCYGLVTPAAVRVDAGLGWPSSPARALSAARAARVAQPMTATRRVAAGRPSTPTRTK